MNNLLLVPAFFLLGMGSQCHAVTHWVPKEGTPTTHQCKADTHITFRQVVRRLWWPDKWRHEHCWICFWDFTIPCSVMRGRAIRHEWQQLSCRHLAAFQPCRGSSAFSRGVTMSSWAGSNTLGCCRHFFVCKTQGYPGSLAFSETAWALTSIASCLSQHFWWYLVENTIHVCSH